MATTSHEVLKEFGAHIMSEDVFDEEDIKLWKATVQALESGASDRIIEDATLEALRRFVPARRRRVQELDQKFQLTQRFPELMKRFATKDAELAFMLQERERAAGAGLGAAQNPPPS